MKAKTLLTIGIGWTLFVLSIAGGAIYVAVHFIIKYW